MLAFRGIFLNVNFSQINYQTHDLCKILCLGYYLVIWHHSFLLQSWKVTIHNRIRVLNVILLTDQQLSKDFFQKFTYVICVLLSNYLFSSRNFSMKVKVFNILLCKEIALTFFDFIQIIDNWLLLKIEVGCTIDWLLMIL